MFKFIKKYPVVFWGIIVAIILITVLGVWQRQEYMKNPYENQIGNPKREAQSFQDEFYLKQLSNKEVTAYNALKEAIQNFQGGEFVFSEKLNGKEYARVVQALQCGEDDLFYALVDVPMTDKNQNVSYIESDVTEIKENIIAKCVIFLYPAEGIDINGKIDDDGYVTNLNDLKEPLSTLDETKKQEIDNIISEEENMIKEVVAGLPEEYGKKQAVDYFLKWMDKNLKLDEEIMQSTEDVKNMTDAFGKVYFESNSSCIVNKKATATGYTRLLVRMCNRVGIETHVVMGNWSGSNAYTLAYMKFDDKDVYIDASGYRKKDLWDQRYLSETLVQRKMTFSKLFEI